jgi:hypothetical protein
MPDAQATDRAEPQTLRDAGKQSAGSAGSPGSSNSSAGAGAGTPRDAGVVDAGARPQVDDPIGVLIDLARRTPQGKTADTIDRFLEALQKGDAPASSIRGFLLAIDEEIDCRMNPLATECLAACQAVSTTCVVCVLDEQCRTALLDICGLSALAGCTQRR